MARYLRSDEHRMPAALVACVRAFAARDLAAVRATLPDDFALDDRRRIGFGRIEGADAYMASLAALLELSPDARISTRYGVVAAGHGRVVVMCSRIPASLLEAELSNLDPAAWRADSSRELGYQPPARDAAGP
ncbi:nuclear transport factor 2 family protein [bacterium]|nr:nuclear transport factor 2 family protein [bacterium]